MFKPMLIGSALVGALTAPAVLAEQAPATQVQTPDPAQAATAAAPQLPAWVKERHAELGMPPGGQPYGMTAVPAEPPRIPEWVKERHSQAPRRRLHPSRQQCRRRPTGRPRLQAGQLPPPPPEIPAWVKEHRARMSTPDAPQAPKPPQVTEKPAVPEMPAAPAEVPAWVQQHRAQMGETPFAGDMRPMPEMPATHEPPAWVSEQRGQMAAPVAPQRPEMPPMREVPSAPEPPAWLSEQRGQVAAPVAPQRPEMPPMREVPSAPEPPAWVSEKRGRMAAPMAPQRPQMPRMRRGTGSSARSSPRCTTAPGNAGRAGVFRHACAAGSTTDASGRNPATCLSALGRRSLRRLESPL